MGFLTKVIHSWHTFYLAIHRNTPNIGTQVSPLNKRITKIGKEINKEYRQGTQNKI